MKLNQYSAISFVVATLLLPGQTVATPAAVSGNAESGSTDYTEIHVQEPLLALNGWSYQPMTESFGGTEVKAGRPSRIRQNIDELQQALDIELEAIIDLIGH